MTVRVDPNGFGRPDRTVAYADESISLDGNDRLPALAERP